MGGRAYTSARLVSRGKGDLLYGRVAVRARVPGGLGVWPAIWMLSTDWSYGGWPESGEIDVMEHVGCVPDTVYASVHTKAYNHVQRTQKTQGLRLPDAETAFHEYALEWTPDRVQMEVDSVPYFIFENEKTGFEAWPFDRPFHLILNVAVGGNWGAMRGFDPDIWPRRMEVDYVRVYAHR
jgi:beta-glucanase (GH16 family)